LIWPTTLCKARAGTLSSPLSHSAKLTVIGFRALLVDVAPSSQQNLGGSLFSFMLGMMISSKVALFSHQWFKQGLAT
jgi:hypothetical protein